MDRHHQSRLPFGDTAWPWVQDEGNCTSAAFLSARSSLGPAAGS